MILLKRYAKGLSLSVLAATTFNFGAPAVFAQGQNAPAVAQPATTSTTQNVLGAVKFPPLPVLAEKLTQVSQQANLGVQEQMVLQFMLMQFGYPSFPGISATEGVTVFVLGGESGAENGDVGFVGLARLAADSPLRGVLTQNGLQISDREGWVLIAPTEEAFALVKDLGTLIAIATDKAHFDIETRVYISGGVVNIVKGLFEANLVDEETDQEQVAKVRAWLEFVLKLAENYDWGGYGLSVNEGKLAVGGVIAPKAGTPDAQWINAALPATQVEAGKFLPAKVAASYVARFDVPATQVYLESLASAVQQIPNEKAAQLAKELLEQYGAYLANSSGTLATVTTGMNPVNQQMLGQTLEPGKHEQAKVDAFYGYLFNKLVPELFALFGEIVDDGEIFTDLFKAEQQAGVDAIGAASVSVVRYTSPDPQDPSQKITQETYYTVINGAVLTASTLDSLKPLAATYSAGKAVANNLMAAHPLPANSWVRGSLDIGLVIKAIAGSLGNDADAEATAILTRLDALNLQPISVQAQADRGRGIYEMSIPMDSVAKLVHFVRSLEAENAVEVEEVQINEVQVAPAN